MDYQIVWSKPALQDLHDLVRYIAADDSTTAMRFGERIITKVEGLASFPRIGRIVPELRDDLIREVILTPYRVIYEVSDADATLSILRIWHGARGEPEVSK